MLSVAFANHLSLSRSQAKWYFHVEFCVHWRKQLVAIRVILVWHTGTHLQPPAVRQEKGVLKNPRRRFSSPLDTGQTVYVDPISLLTRLELSSQSWTWGLGCYADDGGRATKLAVKSVHSRTASWLLPILHTVLWVIFKTEKITNFLMWFVTQNCISFFPGKGCKIM